MDFPSHGFQTAGQAQLHDDLYGTEYATGPRAVQDWDERSKWVTAPKDVPEPPPPPEISRLAYVHCARCDTTQFVTCPTCIGRLYWAGDHRPRCSTCQGSGRIPCAHCQSTGYIIKEAV